MTISRGRTASIAVNALMQADSEQPTMLLKPAQVAARLAVSRTWVYDAAKDGRIPSVRIGGEDGPLRFIPEDVEHWLEQARAGWLPGRGPGGRRSRPISPIAGPSVSGDAGRFHMRSNP
jgi:excisionase family DNA binding protein